MMVNKTRLILFGIGLSIVGIISLLECKEKESSVLPVSAINTAHLDHLYEEIKFGSDSVGIIHIYSEYPDYHLVGDADEGIACVDDASRAAIFYFLQYQKTDSTAYLHKGKQLMKFILAMQSDSGYFYNFIFPDHTINKLGHTSRAEPSWWSWRSLWAMGVAIEVGGSMDKEFTDRIKSQRNLLIKNILHEPAYQPAVIDTAMGLTIPAWLPKGSGTDQASIILLGLMQSISQEPDNSLNDSIKKFILHFADGIRMMQVHSPDSLEDGAFLSWENLWHAYGNIQAYTMLKVGKKLKDSSMIAAGLKEVTTFYPAVIKAGGLEHFWVKKNGNFISRYETKSFNQIAYGRRPMIWATLQAHEMNAQQDKNYLDQACQLGMWFFGDNPAHEVMYDMKTGRGYDGINSTTEINRNSGAESTIESLLALQALENHGAYYNSQTKSFEINP